MEQGRHKSKISASVRGKLHMSKQRSDLKPASNLRSRGGTTEKDEMMCEPRPSSTKQIDGTLMKDLLAEEMSKVVEVKRRSPNVIARLMGLDVLPSPRPVQKRGKLRPENCESHTVSLGGQRNIQHYEIMSNNKKTSFEHQEFKDVYEDLEASHAANHRYSSKCVENLESTKSELVSLQNKFFYANYLSSGQNPHISKDIHDTLGIAEYEEELEHNFFEQQELCTLRHPRNLEDNLSGSPCNNIVVLKPENLAKHEVNSMGCGLERTQKFSTHNKGVGVEASAKLSKLQTQETEGYVSPTRIVVLKPNFVKVHNTRNCTSSPDPPSYCFHPTYTKHAESLSFPSEEKKSWKLRPGSKEAREIAREITRQMKENFHSKPVNLLNSVSKGYAGDESSCYLSESDSTSDSEVVSLNSSHSIDRRTNMKKASFSHSTVKSERRRTASRSHSKGVFDTVGTLNDMLAIPHREMMYRKVKGLVDSEAARERYADNETEGWNSPPTKSCRHASKYRCTKNSYGVESLPTFSSSTGKERSNSKGKVLASHRRYLSKESGIQGRSRLVKQNLNRQDDFSARQIKSHCRKTHSSSVHINVSENFPDMHSDEVRTTNSHLDRDILEQQRSEVHTSIVDMVDTDGQETQFMYSKFSDGLPQKTSTYMSGDCSSSACETKEATCQDVSVKISEELQLLGPEPVSSDSCKEVDHSSPVSVLEDCFAEDKSSNSQYFERVSADIRELRSQLQLLKMEYASDVNIPSFSDEEIGQGCFTSLEEIQVTSSQEDSIVCAKSWELSHLYDVLVESGFGDVNSELFITTCHTSESSLVSWIFKNLEKKYYDEISGQDAERKLLTDRINLALLEISRLYVKSLTYAEPASSRVRTNLLNHGFKDELCKLLAMQEKEANGFSSERILDQEMHWLDFHEQIEAIGEDIEKFLVNDLIVEAVCCNH